MHKCQSLGEVCKTVNNSKTIAVCQGGGGGGDPMKRRNCAILAELSSKLRSGCQNLFLLKRLASKHDDLLFVLAQHPDENWISSTPSAQ